MGTEERLPPAGSLDIAPHTPKTTAAKNDHGSPKAGVGALRPLRVDQHHSPLVRQRWVESLRALSHHHLHRHPTCSYIALRRLVGFLFSVGCVCCFVLVGECFCAAQDGAATDKEELFTHIMTFLHASLPPTTNPTSQKWAASLASGPHTGDTDHPPKCEPLGPIALTTGSPLRLPKAKVLVDGEQHLPPHQYYKSWLWDHLPLRLLLVIAAN